MDLPAGSPPGARLDPNIYSGTVTVTNTTTTTVTSITGEERAGFISGPSTLTPGRLGTYTFTLEGSSVGDLPDEQALPLMFSGEGPSGLVNGSGIAYFKFPNPRRVEAHDHCCDHQRSPVSRIRSADPDGSVFKGTVTLTNSTSSTVTGIFGETSQAVHLLATASPSGSQAPPLVLGDFNLAVPATNR